MDVKEEIGKELKLQLKMGYDVIRIAEWAYSFYLENMGRLTPETQEVLEYLFMMEEGPEFEFTEEQLHLLVINLLQKADRPMKGVHPKL